MDKYKSHRDMFGYVKIPGSKLDFVTVKNWPDSPEMVAAVMEYAKACDEENTVTFKAYLAIYEDFAKAFATMEPVFEHGSTKKKTKRAKALDELRPRRPEPCVRHVEDTLRFHGESTRRSKEEQARIDARNKREQLVMRAAQFLNGRGYKLGLSGRWSKEGVDHEDTDVVDVANDVRCSELITEAKKIDSCIPFDGSRDRCTDGCAGWDKESTRCMCGFRRVSWSFHGDFTNMSIYAEAY